MAELVEGARLEIVCTSEKGYRGFESLSLRQELRVPAKIAGTLSFVLDAKFVYFYLRQNLHNLGFAFVYFFPIRATYPI